MTVLGLSASLALALPVFAATSVQGWGGGGMHRGGGAPGVFGTVNAVNGTTLTVTAKVRPNATSTAAPTVYTVDASNAKIYKGSAMSAVSVSNIATGDTVMVQGAVDGSNVTATIIRDGVVGGMIGRPGMPGGQVLDHGASSTPGGASAIKGNGEPVVGGSVTAISGASLTVTNASNVTYTIDTTSATIVKNGTTSTIASVAVGDGVVVQGAVNGTSITASSVIDHGARGTQASSTGPGGPRGGSFGGIFSAIGGFFQHLFGF